MFRSLNPGMIGVSASFDQCCQWAEKAGFGGISINLEQLPQLGVEPTKELLEKHHLKPSICGLPVEFRQDEATFQESIDAFPEQARLAAQVGLDRCSTWVLPGQKGLSEKEYFDLMKNRLGQCASILHDHGIRFGLEFIGPKTLRDSLEIEGLGLSTSDRMLELCHAIPAPGVGLLLDAWHWYTSHGTAETLGPISNQDIVDVHVNDAPLGKGIDELQDTVRELPGATGVIDLDLFFSHLQQVEYDGPVEAEPFNAELSALDDWEAIKKTGEALSRWID